MLAHRGVTGNETRLTGRPPLRASPLGRFRRPTVAALHVVTALVLLLGDELDADPHRRAADDLQVRELKQADGKEREDDAQDDRADRAPEHAPASLLRRQVAARERDATALSPDSRMLMTTISRAASQNCGVPISMLP